MYNACCNLTAGIMCKWLMLRGMCGRCYLSSHLRKSSTRERLTVISNDDAGSATMRSRPPACLMMLLIAFSDTMQPLDMRKKYSGLNSSLITSSDESIGEVLPPETRSGLRIGFADAQEAGQ